MKKTLNVTALICLLLVNFTLSSVVFAQNSAPKPQEILAEGRLDLIEQGYFTDTYQAEIWVLIDGEGYDFVLSDFSYVRQTKSQKMRGYAATQQLENDITVTAEITHERLPLQFQSMSNFQGDAGRKGGKMFNLVVEQNGKILKKFERYSK